MNKIKIYLMTLIGSSNLFLGMERLQEREQQRQNIQQEQHLINNQERKKQQQKTLLANYGRLMFEEVSRAAFAALGLNVHIYIKRMEIVENDNTIRSQIQ
jgi:hypothetical protein